MYVKLKNSEYRFYSLAIQHYYLVQHKRLTTIEEYNSVYYIKYQVINNWINDNQQDLICVKMEPQTYFKVMIALDYFTDYIEKEDIQLSNIYNHLIKKLIDSQRRN